MEAQIIKREPTFVNLTNKLLAEYFLIYRINDSYSVSDFSKFSNKQQLFFEKIEDNNQQLNLMFVDSVFVNILSDLTLEVLLSNIGSFQDYILSSDKLKFVQVSDDNIFLTYKFLDFLHLLLFGDISSSIPFNQKLYTDRVFCLRNNFGEIEYFSIYEQSELQSKLLNEIKVEIDYNLSNISKQQVRLCLKFSL